MSPEKFLFNFLEKQYDTKFPVLLALSGGGDSLALFYMLTNYRKQKPLNFAIAHVDHGWRRESADEARKIQQIAAEMHVPFHLKTLDPQKISGNLEEKCRHERLAFYRELCSQYQYQAVILGHHADDRSETVLKRVLEGSSLPYIYGMSILSSYEGLNLWRPLLSCLKADISSWLAERKLIPFQDPTNFDQRFLRGRFRTQILPDLSRDFGKKIGSSLLRIGSESEELKKYLDAQLEILIKDIVQGPYGSFLDLSQQCPVWEIELKYLIRRLCEKEGIRLSHHRMEEACHKIRLKSANCQLHPFFYIDRGRLFALKESLVDFNYKIQLHPGLQTIDRWRIEVQEMDEEVLVSGWKEAWQGKMSVRVPEGNYTLERGDNSLSHWWTNAKVPAFLRWGFPVLRSGEAIIHEFLTKRRYAQVDLKKGKQWLISLSS